MLAPSLPLDHPNFANHLKSRSFLHQIDSRTVKHNDKNLGFWICWGKSADSNTRELANIRRLLTELLAAELTGIASELPR